MKKVDISTPKLPDVYALVDDEDYESLLLHKWHASPTTYGGFVARRVISGSVRNKRKQETVYMHREIMSLAKGDKRVIDHLYHDTLNNQRYNLRVCSQSENVMNTKKRAGCSSKYRGVSWCNTTKKWCVTMRINGKLKHLGRYNQEKKAAQVYNEVAIKNRGTSAILNVIEVNYD